MVRNTKPSTTLRPDGSTGISKTRRAEAEAAEMFGEEVNSKTFTLKAISMVVEYGNPKKAAESFAKYWGNKGYKIADADQFIGGFGSGYGLSWMPAKKRTRITSDVGLMIAYEGKLTKSICFDLSNAAFGS